MVIYNVSGVIQCIYTSTFYMPLQNLLHSTYTIEMCLHFSILATDLIVIHCTFF